MFVDFGYTRPQRPVGILLGGHCGSERAWQRLPFPRHHGQPSHWGVETEWQLLLWNRSDDSQLLAAMSPVPFVFDATYYIIYIYKYLYNVFMFEGSLEVKLPTIWTDEKQSREEAERRERLEERRVEEKE